MTISSNDPGSLTEPPVRPESRLAPDARIAVLLSGGVDSSVALVRLRERGFRNITAYYLKIWLEDELSYLGSCPWEEDLSYASAVAEAAGVPLVTVPLQREYYERVVLYTVSELKAGRTPSPDIMCNGRIKFQAFYDKIEGEVDAVATGHYARLEVRGAEHLMFRAPDPVKDQTYFLSRLAQPQVRKLLFPVGELLKTEVRALAARYALPNRDRKDSQGICFLGKIRYPEFVRHYLGTEQGPIVERETGRTLGAHDGHWFYTIGQRQGLGLSEGPWYVSGKELGTNTVYVSSRPAAEACARDRFTVRDLSWLSSPPETGRLLLKIRHGPGIVPCTVSPLPGGRLEVRMDEPDRGVAAGQFAVFYDRELCLGCGVIE